MPDAAPPPLSLQELKFLLRSIPNVHVAVEPAAALADVENAVRPETARNRLQPPATACNRRPGQSTSVGFSCKLVTGA